MKRSSELEKNIAWQRGILIALGLVVTVGVVGAATSGVNATQIIGFCTLVCVSLLGLLHQTTSAQDVQAKTEEVKHTLDVNDNEKFRMLRKQAQQLAEVKQLVNGNLTAAMLATATALRKVADLTGRPDDISAAVTAEQAHGAREVLEKNQAASNTGSSEHSVGLPGYEHRKQ